MKLYTWPKSGKTETKKEELFSTKTVSKVQKKKEESETGDVCNNAYLLMNGQDLLALCPCWIVVLEYFQSY